MKKKNYFRVFFVLLVASVILHGCFVTPAMIKNIKLLELTLIEQCDSFNLMMKTIRTYPKTTFAIKANAKIDHLDSAKAIYYRLLAYKPMLSKNGIKSAAEDIKSQYVKNKINWEPGLIGLFEEIINDTWLRHGIPQALFDTVACKAVTKSGTDYFTGYSKWTGKKPEGEGRYYRANGQISQGNFWDGRLFGKGMKFKDGILYEGEFINDELNGKGKFTTSKGTVYEGAMKDNLLEGDGTIKYTDGRYEKGCFSKNKLEGAGERKYSQYKYSGEFAEGKFDGIGTYKWLNDTLKWFRGSFVKGKRNGAGELHIPESLVITGNWLNDCPDKVVRIMKYSSVSKKLLPVANWSFENCMITSKAKLGDWEEPLETAVMENLKED